MLSDADKLILKNLVKTQKKIDVNTNSFIDMKINQCECSLDLLDKYRKINVLKGKVKDFTKSPYQVVFDYTINTPQRILFEEEIKNLANYPSLNFKCTITAGAQIKKANTFTISLDESNQIGLFDQLFL
jgi:hypothetical protein